MPGEKLGSCVFSVYWRGLHEDPELFDREQLTGGGARAVQLDGSVYFNTSSSNVYRIAACPISSTVRSPQYTSRGGLFGFRGLRSELSHAAVSLIHHATGSVTGVRNQ